MSRNDAVIIEVSGINGAGGEIVEATGNLNSMGDFTDGGQWKYQTICPKNRRSFIGGCRKCIDFLCQNKNKGQ